MIGGCLDIHSLSEEGSALADLGERKRRRDTGWGLLKRMANKKLKRRKREVQKDTEGH